MKKAVNIPVKCRREADKAAKTDRATKTLTKTGIACVAISAFVCIAQNYGLISSELAVPVAVISLLVMAGQFGAFIETVFGSDDWPEDEERI